MPTLSFDMTRYCRFLLPAVTLFIALTAAGRAEVRMPGVFSDHAVLQRGERTPIWGTAAPGEKVSVKIAHVQGEAAADPHGIWMVRLNLQRESEGPHELVVQGSNKITLTDILIGEVWLCSGQSNMRFHLINSTDGAEEAAHATDPSMRLLYVGLKVSETPVADIKERWTRCDPKTAGEFSAVSYYFGKELRGKVKGPIGMICVSWAATCIEEWMSSPALAADPEFQPILDRWKIRREEYPAKKAEFDKNKDALMAAWAIEAAKAKAEGKHEPLKPGPPPGAPDTPGTSGYYNGEIMPVAPYGIRGAVWYQGENNISRGYQYRKLLPALIRDWRSLWNQGDFPFLIVQLPNYGKVLPQPRSSVWAELREAQALAATSVPNTFLAVTIDVGEDGDIHPKDKKTPGTRLGDIAAKEVYKLPSNAEVYGPTFKSMKVQGNAIQLEFDHAAGLKTTDGKALTDFAIAGEDKAFRWADAVIVGNTVMVSAAGITTPVAVRYNWADAPHGNLCNAASLPAAPFRTDDFPPISLNNH